MIPRKLHELDADFDLVIIGGGITGLAAAWEASLRGLKTCLLEKNDFGWSTSAATSKLIHGGLRYLENYEFGIVRESLRERRILGCAAGHLIKPLPFLLPVYDTSHPGKMIYQAGLVLYDLLSYDRNHQVSDDLRVPHHTWISRSRVMEVEPDIEAKGLQGGFLYYDYQSLHPERLNLEFLKSACSRGAIAVNHFAVENFHTEPTKHGKRVIGVTGRDTISGEKKVVRGKVFINATGPWMDLVLGLVEEKPEASLSRSKGIHLLTDPILKNHAVLFRTRKGGHFFILPWEGYSLIGPTDTPFTDHPDNLHPEHEDVRELIDDVNEAIPGKPLKKEMIRHITIGIRPLIFSGKSTYRASRKSEIYDHAHRGVDGMISVAGGKWTTSRQLGVDLIQMILRKPELASFKQEHVDSSVLPLFGSPGFASSASQYEEESLKKYATKEVPEEVHRHLIILYGTEHLEILSIVKRDASLAKRISDQTNRFDIMAQVVYAIERESALTLEDILNRRLVLGTYGYPGEKAVERVADLAQKMLGWDSHRKKEEIESLKKSYPAMRPPV